MHKTHWLKFISFFTFNYQHIQKIYERNPLNRQMVEKQIAKQRNQNRKM